MLKKGIIQVLSAGLILFMTSCVNESESFGGIAPASKEYYVNFDCALQYAIKIRGNDSLCTRSERLQVKNHYEYTAHRATRAGDDTIDVRFHIINFSDNLGFALVASDSRTTPIYAYSEHGNLDLYDAERNTGFHEFMQNAIDKYRQDITYGLPFDTVVSPILPDPYWVEDLPTVQVGGKTYYVHSHYETEDSVAPLLLTAWNQSAPYNYYCPEAPNAMNGFGGKCLTGCLPLAIAQIMAYHKYGKNLTDINGNVIFLNWGYLHSHYSFSPNDSSYHSRSLAKLIRKIGDVAGAQYENDGTVVSIFNEDNTLHYFGYTSSGLQYPGSMTDNLILNSISHNKPVLSNGFRAINDSIIAGHTWVTDGFSRKDLYLDYYEYAMPHYLHHSLHSIDNITYLHCNWGWGGLYNAYVLNFKVNESKSYSLYNSHIVNIQPDNS